MLKETLYRRILDLLTERFRTDEVTLCRDLKPSVKWLRQQYRSGVVGLYYNSDERVAAYMLGYYPNSVAMAAVVLRRWRHLLPSEASATVLCGGPIPEALALAGNLEAVGPGKTVRISGGDKHADNWSWAVEVTERLCQHYAPRTRLTIATETLDLEQPIDWIYTPFFGSSVCLMQNCLNEIWHARATSENVRDLARNLSVGAIMVFIDQINSYEINTAAVRWLRQMAVDTGFEVLEDAEELFRPAFVMPRCVTHELFDGAFQLDAEGRLVAGLEYVRTNIRSYGFVVRKQREVDDFQW